MFLLRRLRSPDVPEQHFLGHDPLCRIRIAAPSVDGVQANIEDVPAAETRALFREIRNAVEKARGKAQIGLHSLGVG